MTEDKNTDTGDVKPIKLSRGATLALITGGCIVLIILILTIRGCTISKTVDSDEVEETAESTVTESIESPTEVPSSAVEITENQPVPTDVGSASAEEPSVPENTGSTGEHFVTPESDGLNEVAEPSLSELREAMGMVIGKHTYLVDGSYVYGVSVSVIVNDSSVMANYFCPKKTYDQLSSGNSVRVTYQVDSNGRLSVHSISMG